jgi:hypothetical protein
MTNNKQQTAVQLIIQALDIECKSRGMNVNWDMYLEMEKQRLKDAYWAGIDDHLNPNKMPNSEGYYELTFGGNNEQQ